GGRAALPQYRHHRPRPHRRTQQHEGSAEEAACRDLPARPQGFLQRGAEPERLSGVAGRSTHPGGAGGKEPGPQFAVPATGAAAGAGAEPAQQDQSPGGAVRLPGGKEPGQGGAMNTQYLNSEFAANLVALRTIVQREVRRFVRIWPQTLLPPAITMVLYFVIFGNLIGQRIGDMGGFSYMEYIVPGLIMMSVITNSYGNVVSSFFGSKFQRNVEELLVSPVSPHTILVGFVVGGVLRGLAVGVIVTILSL